jgi:hypothetical protein
MKQIILALLITINFVGCSDERAKKFDILPEDQKIILFENVKREIVYNLVCGKFFEEIYRYKMIEVTKN